MAEILTLPIYRGWNHCPSCNVGSTEPQCWICNGPVLEGDVLWSVRNKPDVSMELARTRYDPWPLPKRVEYKAMDEILPLPGGNWG